MTATDERSGRPSGTGRLAPAQGDAIFGGIAPSETPLNQRLLHSEHAGVEKQIVDYRSRTPFSNTSSFRPTDLKSSLPSIPQVVVERVDP